MSALPAAMTEQDARATIDRLAAIEPGRHWVVTCYLKLEPRDRARGKYLIKMKKRVKEGEGGLARPAPAPRLSREPNPPPGDPPRPLYPPARAGTVRGLPAPARASPPPRRRPRAP